MWFENFINNEEFSHQFQPIYNLDSWRIIGYEGLFRSDKFQTPEEMFQFARKQKRLYELDSRSIYKAVRTYQQAGFSNRDGRLFLNIFPSTLERTSIHAFLSNMKNEFQLSSQHIVLEICESEKIQDIAKFRKIIDELKKQGISIALDDIGKGISDIQRIIELEPEYIKLDQYFTVDLHTSKKKQVILESIIRYSDVFQSKLILEGLETPIDLATAKISGVPFGQGYILGKPAFLKEKHRDGSRASFE